MKGIKTRYLGPTNYRGSRIVATDGYNRVTVPYQSENSSEQNHAFAAQALVVRKLKVDKPFEIITGATKDEYLHVLVIKY